MKKDIPQMNDKQIQAYHIHLKRYILKDEYLRDRYFHLAMEVKNSTGRIERNFAIGITSDTKNSTKSFYQLYITKARETEGP